MLYHSDTLLPGCHCGKLLMVHAWLETAHTAAMHTLQQLPCTIHCSHSRWTYPAAGTNAELVWQRTQVLQDVQQAAVREVAQLGPMMMLRHAAVLCQLLGAAAGCCVRHGPRTKDQGGGAAAAGWKPLLLLCV